MISDGAALDRALHGAKSDPRTYLLRFYPEAPVPALDQVDDAAEPLFAECHRGIWVARCDCGAEGVPGPGGVVFLDQPLVWCPRCENVAVGGRWRVVRVPAVWEAIEAVLALRPDPETQNWQSQETLQDLIAENLAHGIEGAHVD